MANPVGVLARCWLLAMLCAPWACEESHDKAQEGESDRRRAVAEAPKAMAMPWATVLEWKPSESAIPDSAIRQSIEQAGLPWRIQHIKTGVELLLVPPGEFVMGMSPGDEYATEYERPAHRVVISQPFYLSRYEVTERQWRTVRMDAYYGPTELERQQTNARRAEIAVQLATGLTRTEAEKRLGSQPAFIDLYGDYPVMGVGVAAFEFLDVTGFRLPSEAQWEYACRAGVRAPHYGPLQEIVHLDGEIHAVGKMQPNAFGFYDMLGNAAELCRDRFGGGDYMDRMDGVVDPDDRLSRANREPRGPSAYSPSPAYSWSRRDQEMHEARMDAEGQKRGMSGAEYEAKSRKWSEQQSVCRVVRGGLKTLESQRASWRVGDGLCLLGTGDYFRDKNRLGLRVARTVKELSIDGDTIVLRTTESD